MSEQLAVHDPARPDEVVGTVVLAPPRELAAQVDRAAAAAPGWAATPVADRLAQLHAAVAPLGARLDELAELLVRENGKVRSEAAVDVGGLAGMIRATEAFAGRLDEQDLDGGARPLRLGRRPLGVVLVLVPSNSPVVLAAAHLAPALVAGNTALVKVPLQCPLAVTEMLTALAAALPPGVVEVVCAADRDVSDVVVGDPRVRGIGLTGGSRSALGVLHALRDVKDVVFELGGNDACVLLDDVEVDAALAARLTAATMSLSGQYCSAIKRLYVHRSRLDEVVQAMAAAFDELVVGDGLLPGTTVGPLGSPGTLDRARGLLERAGAAGTTVLTRGQVPDPGLVERGWFLRPALVVDAAQDGELVQQEQFSPVLPVVAYDDDEQALRMANDTVFGLSGSVWGTDVDRATALADRLEVGIAVVNGTPHDTKDLRAPFGGVKQSGIGRLLSASGLESYSTSFARLGGATRR